MTQHIRTVIANYWIGTKTNDCSHVNSELAIADWTVLFGYAFLVVAIGIRAGREEKIPTIIFSVVGGCHGGQ